jgi:Icc-related predicted phosphoesterase
MNIFCFSDYHNEITILAHLRTQAHKADIIISAGDHSIFTFDQDKILKEFNSWNKPVLITHGNHEEFQELKAACKPYKNLYPHHQEEIIIQDIRILFWGGGGFTTTDAKLDQHLPIWKQNNKQKTILITHAPPYGTKLDAKGKGWHVGNKTITKAIQELQPNYAISGHIHEAAGAEDKIGKTICYNLGPRGRMIVL